MDVITKLKNRVLLIPERTIKDIESIENFKLYFNFSMVTQMDIDLEFENKFEYIHDQDNMSYWQGILTNECYDKIIKYKNELIDSNTLVKDPLTGTEITVSFISMELHVKPKKFFREPSREDFIKEGYIDLDIEATIEDEMVYKPKYD